MVDTSMSVAVSGMTAATRRVDASASNVANVRTRGAVPESSAAAATSAPKVYEALTTTQSAAAGGGVISSITTAAPSWIQEYAPDESYADENGAVAAPNVDLATEAVNQIVASNAYKAGVKTVQTADEMTREAIDMKA